MPDLIEPTEGDFEVSPNGTAIMARTADGLSVVGYVQVSQEEWPANARLFAASKAMLAALQAQEDLAQHFAACTLCEKRPSGLFRLCFEAGQLECRAATLRRQAIAQAQTIAQATGKED